MNGHPVHVGELARYLLLLTQSAVEAAAIAGHPLPLALQWGVLAAGLALDLTAPGKRRSAEGPGHGSDGDGGGADSGLR